MAATRRKTETIEKAEKPKIKCTCCSGEFNTDKFYKSYSILFKGNIESRMCLCKDCILEVYAIYLERTNDRRMATYEVCKKMDVCFLSKLFESAEIQANKNSSNVCQIYFQKINSMKQYKNLTFDNSDSLEGNVKERIARIESGSDLEVNDVDSKTYSKEWKGTYSREDLEYLDNYLTKLQEDFKIITINHIDYAKKIAKASLAMDRAYEDLITGVSGAEGKYRNLKDAFDSLSKSAQFSESNRGESVGVHGISQIVERVESKQWIKSNEKYEKDELDHLMEQFMNINKSL